MCSGQSVQPDPFVWSGRSGCLITVIRPAGPVSRSRSVPVPGALLEKRDLLGLEQHAQEHRGLTRRLSESWLS